MSRTDPAPHFRAGENPEPPSNVRHFVVFACTLMAVLLYVDRYCVSMAEPYIKQDLNLSTFQIGFVFSAFFLTYALLIGNLISRGRSGGGEFPSLRTVCPVTFLRGFIPDNLMFWKMNPVARNRE